MNLIQAIDDKFASSQVSTQRKHIGISSIGNACDRALWYAFNHCLTVQHDGRLLRLFGFGHQIENEMADLLRSVGWKVLTENPRTKQQWAVQDPDNAYFSGSLDGVAVSPADVVFDGVSPSDAHVIDFKTSNDKSFHTFVKKGLIEWNYKYYCQLQCYMGFSHQLGRPINKGMLFAINKNNHELHYEIVEFSQAVFDACRSKAEMIVISENIPAKASEDAKSMICRFCDYKDICHNGRIAEPSCRNCGYCKKSLKDGDSCEKGYSLNPCEDHLYNPALLPSSPTGYHVEISVMEYEAYANGNSRHKDKFDDKPLLTSKEIYDIFNCDDEHVIKDLIKFVKQFDASVKEVSW